MATEITVIVDAGPTLASASERALAFDAMADTRMISYSAASAFAIMYERAIADAVHDVIPTIPELLLRRVIEDASSHEHPPVMPIISEPVIRAAVTGGALPRHVRARVEATPTRADALRVRFDKAVKCVWGSFIYIAPAGEEIEVIGLRITPLPGAVPPGDRLTTGRYTYKDIGIFPLADATRAHDANIDIAVLTAQVERLRPGPNAASIHNALNIAFAGKVNTSVPMDIIEAAIVRKWGPPPPLVGVGGISAVLAAFETVMRGRFSDVIPGSAYADLAGHGLLRLYHRAVLAGVDTAEVREGLSAHIVAQKRAIKAADDAVARDAIRNDLEIYRTLIARKLGAARLREVDQELRRSPQHAVTPGGILTILKPAERKVIDAEFQARAKYIEEATNNNCPHVALLRQLRRAVDDRTASAALAELRDFMVAGPPTQFITCRRCKHDIMCPHTRDFLTLDLAGKPQPVIKSALIKYQHRGGECKICGEALSNMEEFDVVEERTASSNMDEELRNMMWGELAGLTRHLKADTMTDMRALVIAMREAIYRHISDLEKQVIKSKTANEGEIKSKLRLYVAIYGMAYLVRLIERAESLRFRDYKGKTTTADLLKYGLDVIMSTRNVVIREIPGMSLDVIKSALVSAYKLLTVTTAPAEALPAGSLLSTLMLDPIYNYYYVLELITSKRPLPPRKHDREDQVGHILGADLAKLEKLGLVRATPGNIYQHVIRPKMPPGDAFDKLEAFRASSPMTAAVLNGYVTRSFEWFDGKQRLRAFDQHQYINTAPIESETLDVIFRPVHADLERAAKIVLARERVVDQYRAWAGAQPYGCVRPNPPRRLYVDPVLPIARVFDETGAPHRWTKYVIKHADDPVVEMTAQEIAATVEAGAPQRGVVIDRKCDHCGQLESAIGSLSDAKIRAALRSRHDRGNFFRFYGNRCPVGGIHDRPSSGSPCAKCGLVAGTTPDAYFAKYIAGYGAAKGTRMPASDSPPKPPTDVSKYAPDYVGWAHDFTVVVTLADKIGVNHRLISSIGATYNVQYADVLSGVYVPSEPYDRQSSRAALINSHVLSLITEYNRLRFYSTMLKPPQALAAVVDESNYPRHLLPGLATELPDVYGDYNERYLYVSQALKPREIIDFCVQSFCERALKIWGDDTGATAKLRHNFVQYVVRKILRGEELMTKPGEFNWSLLYGDAKEKSYDLERAEPGDNAETVETTDENPMTMDAFDVEDDDEDDPSNTVRVDD